MNFINHFGILSVNLCFNCLHILSRIKNKFSTTQTRSIITLIEKQGKNRLLIDNWRLIALLNYDVKILTKVVSRMTQKHLPKLIHNNQSGFVKGIFIGDSIKVIQYLIEYTDIYDIPGLLLFVDFQKAFDT